MKRAIFCFLSLIPFVLGASDIMEMKSNEFGDVAIHYSPYKSIPNLCLYQNQLVVMTGAPDGFISESLPYFLGKTETLGNLFGNEYANKHFPVIQEGMITSGCSVIFIKYERRTFAVLVQVKKRQLLMNTAGYVEKGESFKDAAIREALEETGLEINPQEWNMFATCIFEQKYAGLNMLGKMVTGYCVLSEMPVQWKNKIVAGPVSKIDIFENDEIENITLLDIAYLSEYKHLNRDGVFSTGLGGRHLNVLIIAAVRTGLASETLLQFQERVNDRINLF